MSSALCVYADDDAVLIPLRAADRSSSSSHTQRTNGAKSSQPKIYFDRERRYCHSSWPQMRIALCVKDRNPPPTGEEDGSKAILCYIQHGHICRPSVRSLLCFWGFVSDFQWAAHQHPFTLSALAILNFLRPLSFLCVASASKASKIWKGRHCQKSSPILYYIDSAVVVIL